MTIKPTTPGFYWVRLIDSGGEPFILFRFGNTKMLTLDGAHWGIQDLEWLHPNPLTPPGIHSLDR